MREIKLKSEVAAALELYRLDKRIKKLEARSNELKRHFRKSVRVPTLFGDIVVQVERRVRKVVDSEKLRNMLGRKADKFFYETPYRSVKVRKFR